MARVAVVTGGTRGIGAAIAKGFKEAGYTVAVCDVVQEQLDSFKNDTGIPGYLINVAEFQSVEAGFKQIESELGPIDVLVNNAGITRDGQMYKMDPEKQWEAVLRVNLFSVFNTCRVASPGMRDRGWGRIINISSMNGQRGQFGQSNYSAAKSGMIGFTRSIAMELAGKKVTCNCVAPGFIMTEMTGQMPKEILEGEVKKIPVGRIGQPEDIADACVFLASDKASFITGQTLSVNGGQLQN
jgi:acetoacetyl-CoA reductase